MKSIKAIKSIKALSLLLCITTLSIAGLASKKHSKHVHGEAEVQIGFEDRQGVIFLQVPSEAIVGFEHKGKNEAQKKQYLERIKKLEDQAKQMVTLPEACNFEKVDLKSIAESDQDSAHSDLVVEYSIDCSSSVKGKNLELNFQKFYPGIKKMNVELTAPSGAKKMTLRVPGEVTL